MSSSSVRTTRASNTGLKLFLTVVCLGAMTGGFFVGRMAYRSINEARQSVQWPTVPGRIVRSGVDVSVSEDRSRPVNDRETRSYSAVISYEFEVDGKPFTGSRIAVVSDQFGSEAWAEATAEKFPVGTDVTVSYNPDNPEQSVLEPGRWGGAGFMVILSSGLLLFPPLILKAIWSNKPVPSGFHPETLSQRMLEGLEFRERILSWEPGTLIHVQRDSISILSIIGGAVIAGLFMGLLFGLVPALFFFSGRGPIFIGQFYLAASALSAIVGAIWLWFDNRPRETRIEWASQLIRLVAGSRVRDAAFSDVQQLTVTIPKARKTESMDSNHQPQKLAACINMTLDGKSYIILESECDENSRRTVRSKLSSLAERLASLMNVDFLDAS